MVTVRCILRVDKQNNPDSIRCRDYFVLLFRSQCHNGIFLSGTARGDNARNEGEQYADGYQQNCHAQRQIGAQIGDAR